MGRTVGATRRGPVPWLRRLVVLVVTVLLTGSSPAAVSAEDGQVARTPPRLSMVEGEVSFWRPGDEEWAPARVNTAVAPGDLLDTGANGRLELQVGGHAFLRADADTEIGLEDQEADLLRLQVTRGRVSLDLRELLHQHRIQVATPAASYSIEDAGYYRFEVGQDSTACIVRSGGRATVTTDGQFAVVRSDEKVIVTTTSGRQAPTCRAPALDDWDRWNYGRTDGIRAAISDRYVPSDMYGVADLDRYGSWRRLPTYGRVWVPTTVAAAWAPYSAGTWMWDPFYGWTWVDDAPWGWAPFHYGRWVYADAYWAWVPGPIVFSARPVYAPALVAFYSGPGIAVSVGTPFVGWVALSWGEPLVPWWGPPGFIGVPWWGGWGGPRVVNHISVHHKTIVHAGKLARYRNARAPRALIGIERARFVRGSPKRHQLVHLDPHRLGPRHNPPARTPKSISGRPPAPGAPRVTATERGRPAVRARRAAGEESRRQRGEQSGRRSDQDRMVHRREDPGALARREERGEQGRVRPSRRDDARRPPTSSDPPSLAPEDSPRSSGTDAGNARARRDQLRKHDRGSFGSRPVDRGDASQPERRAPDTARRPPTSAGELASLSRRERAQEGGERGRMSMPSFGFQRQPAPRLRDSRPPAVTMRPGRAHGVPSGTRARRPR